MNLINSRPELMNLSFSGCGFLCIYHAGVAAAIKEYAPQLLQNKILGASAGSIIACGLITDVCLSHATSTILKVVSQARSRTFGPLHPEFNLLGIVRVELMKILPPNAYELCTNRLVISLTRWSDHENVMIEEYTSNEDLIDAITCSCFIPLYCGLSPPKFRGVQYIDGGVSDNQPKYDEHTVTVSPFSGESDICPPDWDSGSLLGLDFNGTSIRFTTRNMFRLMACLWPRSTEDCSRMCLQGFADGLRFLTKVGMSPCIRCLTIQTVDGTVPGVASSECMSEVDEKVESRKCIASPPSGMARIRKRSSAPALGTRGESECETCCESDLMLDEVNVNSVFPSIMRKPFEEAVAAENSLFQYILSFRLIRYASTALGVSKFPLDIGIAFVRMVHNYLEIMSPPRWIMLKLRNLADLVKSELERQKNRYTNFSCFVQVTDVDRFGSALSQSVSENQEEREIELSEEAKKELKLLRERDRKRKLLKKNLSLETTISEKPTETYDVDSYEHVVEFTRTHEAMYEFHYLDENNKMRTFGLFADKHNHSGTSPCSSHRPSVSSQPTTSRLVYVPEEDEEISTPKSDGVMFEGGEEIVEEEADEEMESDDERDSGLSGIETKQATPNVSPPTVTSKRDACCSPVRDFSATDGGEVLAVVVPTNVADGDTSPKTGFTRARGSQRRYGASDLVSRKTPTLPTKKKSTNAASHVSMSSDSEEVDGSEKLFVPSRKAWRAARND